MKFGSAAGLALSPLSRMFQFFESSYEPGFILLSKIFANVIPRVGLTRNPNERQEVLFNELTQGGLLFAALPITSFLGAPVMSALSGIPRKLIRMRNSEALAQALEKGGELLQNRLKVAKLGHSIGASAFIAALLIATSYLRNYRTIKRTGFSDYKKVIGLGNAKPTAEDKAKAEIALKKNMRIMQGLAIGGGLAWLGIMTAAGIISRRGTGLLQAGRLFSKERLDRLMKHWAFVGKHSDQINGPFRSPWQTLMVWGGPSYVGWLLGCRDKYELVEQASKFLTFMGGYFWTPKIVKNIMNSRNKPLLAEAAKFGEMTYTNVIQNVAKEAPETAQKLVRFMNGKWGLLTAMNFSIAGVMPLIFNIFFSKWRHQREEREKGQQPAQGQNVSGTNLRAGLSVSGGLQRKSFAEWGRTGRYSQFSSGRAFIR